MNLETTILLYLLGTQLQAEDQLEFATPSCTETSHTYVVV